MKAWKYISENNVILMKWEANENINKYSILII